MDKFIIFKLKDVTPAGASLSDDGTGIEIISLPVKSISYMTASTGKVNIFYNDVSAYDESNLSTGESTQKSFVTISCEVGEEFTTIESISNFSGLTTTSDALVFDADEIGTISAVVHAHPVNRVTGKASVVTDNGFTAVSSNTINDINFGSVENKPILDLDFRNAVFNGTLSSGASGNISALVNSGTGGSSFNFASVTGDVTQLAGNNASNIKDSINTGRFLTSSYITLANQLTVRKDYTMYMVYTNGTVATTKQSPLIYGVDAGDTSGGIGVFPNAFDAIKTNIRNKVGIQYNERFGDAALQDTFVSLDEVTPCVVVIRRDDDFNVSGYNANGDLLFSIPAVIGEAATDSSPIVTSGATDGDLVILNVGTVSENTTLSFEGRLARFGVIERDIGSFECQRLAKDLFDFYSF